MSEEWKDVKGYEGLYKVSSYGRLRGHRFYRKEGRILRLCKDRKGYIITALYKAGCRKAVFIHKLVAEAFIPNLENKPVVNHKDCIKNNNHVENLEWVTHLEDKIHAVEMKRHAYQKGTWNPSAKLSNEDVLAIREAHLAGATMQDLAGEYEVSHPTIQYIIVRKTWKHI